MDPNTYKEDNTRYDPSNYNVIKAVLKNAHYYQEFIRESLVRKNFHKYMEITSKITAEMYKIQQILNAMNRELAIEKGEKYHIWIDYRVADEDTLINVMAIGNEIRTLCSEFMSKKQMKVLRQKEGDIDNIRPNFRTNASYGAGLRNNR